MSRDRLVSPSDGKVLVAGKVKDGMIDQVKGSSFTVAQFLGPSPTATARESSQVKYIYKIFLIKNLFREVLCTKETILTTASVTVRTCFTTQKLMKCITV